MTVSRVTCWEVSFASRDPSLKPPSLSQALFHSHSPMVGEPVTPTPSRRVAPAGALKGQQGPGAHSPPCFEANPLHIVLDGTLPGLPEKQRSTASMPGACSVHGPLRTLRAIQSRWWMRGYLQEAGFCPWHWEEGHNRHFILAAKKLPFKFWESFAKCPLKRAIGGIITGENVFYLCGTLNSMEDQNIQCTLQIPHTCIQESTKQALSKVWATSYTYYHFWYWCCLRYNPQAKLHRLRYPFKDTFDTIRSTARKRCPTGVVRFIQQHKLRLTDW